MIWTLLHFKLRQRLLMKRPTPQSKMIRRPKPSDCCLHRDVICPLSVILPTSSLSFHANCHHSDSSSLSSCRSIGPRAPIVVPNSFWPSDLLTPPQRPSPKAVAELSRDSTRARACSSPRRRAARAPVGRGAASGRRRVSAPRNSVQFDQ